MQGSSGESGFPLYKQLVERIKYYILTGKLTMKRKLVPPKALGNTLGINKNTIITAYKQLESEGFLVTKNGQGTFVSGLPERWENREGCTELIKLAQTAREKALQLGFTAEDWFTVVFNQTILEKTIPVTIALDAEAKEEVKQHVLFISNSSESPEKLINELRSAFLFYLPIKVLALSELESRLEDDLVKDAYCIYTLVPLVKTVEAIVKPCNKTVMGLPYWLKAEYPWE